MTAIFDVLDRNDMFRFTGAALSDQRREGREAFGYELQGQMMLLGSSCSNHSFRFLFLTITFRHAVFIVSLCRYLTIVEFVQIRWIILWLKTAATVCKAPMRSRRADI